MALIGVGCRVGIRAEVQGSVGMGFQLKLDPTTATGLEESLHEGKWCLLGMTHARISVGVTVWIFGALELSSLFQSQQTEC